MTSPKKEKNQQVKETLQDLKIEIKRIKKTESVEILGMDCLENQTDTITSIKIWELESESQRLKRQ